MTPIDHQQIAALAYTLWQQRGHPTGSPEVDWSAAEAQLHSALIEGHADDEPPHASTETPNHFANAKPSSVRTDELFNDEDTPVPLTHTLTNFE